MSNARNQRCTKGVKARVRSVSILCIADGIYSVAGYSHNVVYDPWEQLIHDTDESDPEYADAYFKHTKWDIVHVTEVLGRR